MVSVDGGLAMIYGPFNSYAKALSLGMSSRGSHSRWRVYRLITRGLAGVGLVSRWGCEGGWSYRLVPNWTMIGFVVESRARAC